MKNKQLTERYQGRVGDFISQMMNEPTQVADELKDRQQLTYEHQMSRLSA